MNNRIYLDYAATTPTHPEVVKWMLRFFTDSFGNPSSLYSFGREAHAAVDEARRKVAGLIGAREGEIVFTGSGTEADNLALKGAALAGRKKGNHIITSSIEHHAVLEACKFLEGEGFRVTYLPVDGTGLVSPDQVKQAITPGTILISIMHANNEIGVIEPVRDIGRIAREAGVLFHCDAVQTTGHIPLDVNEFNVDLLAASAHKLYGPKGVGFLYIRQGVRLTPLIHGGEQEKGRRASTENVAGIAGLGCAADIARSEMEPESRRLTALRDRLIEGLLAGTSGVRLNGHPRIRLPNNVNITLDRVDGEAVVTGLDREGICVSTRSACNSSSREPSHVLRALGLPPQETYGSVRFTLGKWTAEQDIDRVLEVFPRVIAKIREASTLSGRRRGRNP